MKQAFCTFLLLLAPALSLLAPRYLLADDLFSMTLDELMQVQITGSTLSPQSLKTVPSAVTIFTHQEIKRMGLDTLDELTNLVPGYQSYRSSTSSILYPYSSRGRRISTSSAEILVMVDGQRLDGATFNGSTQFTPKYALTNIERVEFIRGPGSAIYGSNAMLGVINIITRSNVNELTASVGSFDRQKLSLLSSYKTDDVQIDFFGQIDTDNGDNYRIQDTFSTGRINTDDPREIADFVLKLKWEKTRLNLHHNQFKTENFYSLGFISNGFNARNGQISSISLRHDLNWRNISSWVWLSYNRSKLQIKSQLTAPGALASISAPMSNEALFVDATFNNTSEARVQWHNDWKINTRSSLQFGTELRKIDNPKTTTKNNFDLGNLANGVIPIPFYGALLPTTVVQNKSNREIMGLYAQYQSRFYNATHLTVGLRYDKFSKIGSNLSPRIGLVHELNDHHSLKLLYGEAFRAPNESELNLVNNPVLKGDVNLQSETVKSWDLIWVGQWPHSSFSLGVFKNTFKNSIVEAAGSGGARQLTNAAQGPVKGLEFELSHELNKHWLLRTTYTHFNEKPNLSFREAEQLVSLMLNFNQRNWNANLIALWQGKREMSTGGSDSNLISLDDYWQLFGKINYRINSEWQSYVQVKNLLDNNYLTPTTSSNLTEGVPNRGREILVGATWLF